MEKMLDIKRVLESKLFETQA